uniref:Activator of basal transcription 1 n=1 Tax=Amblyomma triste TaxID=251400 RepID=A0A023GB21_AMBTT
MAEEANDAVRDDEERCALAASNDAASDDPGSACGSDGTGKKKTDKVKKQKTPGVVYLSYIPPKMNVKTVRSMLSKFGEVGRIFLQPEKEHGRPRNFVEGWVEFMDKKVAKRVAATLNGVQVGGKRRAEYYHSLWSIKYLHRFRWTHLNERLAYEKAVRDQRLRTEIAQAKRESNYYISAVQKSKRMRREEKEGGDSAGSRPSIDVRQRATDDEVIAKRMKKNAEESLKTGADLSLLKNIFISGVAGSDGSENELDT